MNHARIPFAIAWLALSVQAAPPMDLTGGFRTLRGQRPLTENDLVYKDNAQPDQVVTTKPLPLKYSVVGRSLPGRQGREVHEFHAGDPVVFIKKSTDKRWVAVETMGTVGGRGRRKAWIPATAINVADIPEPAKPKPAAPSFSFGGGDSVAGSGGAGAAGGAGAGRSPASVFDSGSVAPPDPFGGSGSSASFDDGPSAPGAGSGAVPSSSGSGGGSAGGGTAKPAEQYEDF